MIADTYQIQMSLQRLRYIFRFSLVCLERRINTDDAKTSHTPYPSALTPNKNSRISYFYGPIVFKDNFMHAACVDYDLITNILRFIPGGTWQKEYKL